MKIILHHSGVRSTVGNLTTLSDFNANFPGFPVQLVARDMVNIFKISVGDLFARFQKTQIFKAFSEAAIGLAEPAGLVFSWPTVGQMVLHNHAGAASHSRFQWRLSGGAPLFLEPLRDATRKQGFLYEIGSDWVS